MWPHPRRSFLFAALTVSACSQPLPDNPLTDAATVDAVDAPDVRAPLDVIALVDVPRADVVSHDAPDASRDVPVAPRDVPVAPRDVPVAPRDVPVVVPCRTRVTYGNAWLRPADHAEAYDDVDGLVTWDGACVADGANSVATLSNGWRPYFAGHGRCEIALDADHCPAAPAACATRLSYGSAWVHADGHPAQYDDVGELADWDGVCHRDGARSYAVLSNGWRPYFNGSSCEVSSRQTQCGPRYVNPVVGGDCPDPGVLRDGRDYYLVCTSGNAAEAFPLRRSRDLVHWEYLHPIFAAGHRPSWASGDFWAPEMHHIGSRYVVYYSARQAGGGLALGAAWSDSPTGTFTDLGHPLLADAAVGLIDATAFTAADGASYLYWKEDGNAVGRSTPIRGQRLGADGLSLTGARSGALITNDLAWEGALVEGPWVVSHDGSIYLFYSANAYYDGRYAVGVARASSPLGPFAKHGAAILVSDAGFVGPGHGSVVDDPSGGSVFVYHAWRAGYVNGAGDGRELLVDRVAWSGGWPSLPGAPSTTAQPYP